MAGTVLGQPSGLTKSRGDFRVPPEGARGRVEVFNRRLGQVPVWQDADVVRGVPASLNRAGQGIGTAVKHPAKDAGGFTAGRPPKRLHHHLHGGLQGNPCAIGDLSGGHECIGDFAGTATNGAGRLSPAAESSSGRGKFRNASIIGAGDPAAATAADRPQKTPIDAATDITEADIARPAYDPEDARNLAADIAQSIRARYETAAERTVNLPSGGA